MGQQTQSSSFSNGIPPKVKDVNATSLTPHSEKWTVKFFYFYCQGITGKNDIGIQIRGRIMVADEWV